MKDKDQIKELFSEKLGNFEANVNPALWENIASQVAVQSTAAATGISLLAKLIIGALSAAAVTGLIVYGMSETPKENQKENKQVQTSSVELVENDIVKDSNAEVNQKNTEEISNEIVVETEELQSNEINILIAEEQNSEAIVNDQGGVLQEKNQQDEIVEKSVVEKVNSPVKKEEIYVPIKGVEELLFDIGPINEVDLETSEAYSIEKMPNFFSPNNDGQNDVFFINTTGLTDFNLVVMDKNNKTVFQTSNPDFKWNGTGIDGLPISKGRYVYFLTAKDENENPVNKYSSLTVR